MAKRTGPTNPYLKSLVEELRKKSFEIKSPIWRDVAEKLSRSRRRKVAVNIFEIEKNTEKNDFVVVPGVVLSVGELSKPVHIAAWKFSASAEEKIKKSKGKMMTIEELVKEKPKGTGVKILV
jgi:large subunit ribosomal protein L18e